MDFLFFRSTGLRVTIAKLETPIVEVYMCVPTEVWNDDGAPHVLEHLLFQRRYIFRHFPTYFFILKRVFFFAIGKQQAIVPQLICIERKFVKSFL